jgi:outer membrane protein assembly factor BamB
VTNTTPLRYQTNAICFDPPTGRVLWREEFDDLAIGVIAQGSFSGLWAWRSRLGVIDLETGTNTILRQSPHSLGWPIRDGGNIVVPWFGNKEVGIEWMDEQGRQVRAGQWPEPKVKEITLHPTDDGLGVQTNSQSFWWLGREATPIWKVRAKPYIYRVHRAADSDVFIGTDGMGGRLLAFDPNSGRETRNIKPTTGGFGDLTRIPGRPLLASTFMINRTYPLQCRLFVINMLDHQHSLRDRPSSVLGTWDGGVVGRTGRTWEHLAVFDIP